MCELYVQDTVSYAHILRTPPCNVLHGHNGRVEIWVRGEIRADSGMVVNFMALKEVVRKYDHKTLLNRWDCQDSEGLVVYKGLNGNYMFQQVDVVKLEGEPTAEIIAKTILEELEGKGLKARVRLWETCRAYCEVCSEQYLVER